MTVRIVELTEPTTQAAAEVRDLVGALSSSAAPLTRDGLAAVAADPAATVLLASVEDVVVGMLTLVRFRLPTGLRAWIEDVVVGPRARGTGVGSALVDEAVRRARASGARSVDLTSRPSRAAAHRLYLRAGFVPRDTTIYRLDLDRPGD